MLALDLGSANLLGSNRWMAAKGSLYTAFHEAGHFVAAVDLGGGAFWPTSVTLAGEKDSRGHVDISRDYDAWGVSTVENFIIFLLCGFVIERIAGFDVSGAGGDVQLAGALATVLESRSPQPAEECVAVLKALDPGGHEAAIARARLVGERRRNDPRRQRLLLRAQAHLERRWPAVDRLANALCEKKTLTAEAGRDLRHPHRQLRDARHRTVGLPARLPRPRVVSSS